MSASLRKCARWLRCFIDSAGWFRFLLSFGAFHQIQHNNSMLFVLRLCLWPRSDRPWCMSVHWRLSNPCWSTTASYRLSQYANGHVHVPASLSLTCCGRLAWPTLFSRSGQQVLGSCILAQLSLEASPGCRVYVGHRERKRTRVCGTHQRFSAKCCQRLRKTLICPGAMTKLRVPLRSSRP